MVEILRRVAKQVVGLERRVEKCMWAEVCRNDQTMHADVGECFHQQQMAKVGPGTCLNFLGAYMYLDGGRDEEFRRTNQGAWMCFHSKNSI